VKETDANRQVLRQAQSQTTVPASGFTSGTSAPAGTIVGTFPTTTVAGSGRVNQTNDALRRSDALRNERMERDHRNFELNRSRQAMQVPSAGRQPPGHSSPMHSENHPSPSMSPRMESPRTPSMRMESRPMGASGSMGSSRSASPSSGGGSMSHGSSGGGGGGHSGGNHR